MKTRTKPWTDENGNRIWELTYMHQYECYNMQEVNEYLAPDAGHTRQVSRYHEVGGDITPLNRHKFRLSILERQVQYLTNERNKINDAIKSCEESIKIFTELKEKEEIKNPDNRRRMF